MTDNITTTLINAETNHSQRPQLPSISPSHPFPVTDGQTPPTRTAWKTHLLDTIPPGEEATTLTAAQNTLNSMHAALRDAQRQRAALRRNITIRERKLTDWKSKIPRVGAIPPRACDIAERVTAIKQGVRCHVVATVAEGGDRGSGNGNEDSTGIVLDKAYLHGLRGLSGFDKMWLVVIVRDARAVCDVLPWALCVRPGCEGLGDGEGGDGNVVVLLLADIMHCDEGKGVIFIRASAGEEGDCVEGGVLRSVLRGAVVVDLKPYLSYCDAEVGTAAVQTHADFGERNGT